MNKASKEAAWEEARKRCRLSEAEIRMAKELGMTPKSLIKNIPAKSQMWKAPVREWIRDLHEKKFGKRPQPAEKAKSSTLKPEGAPKPTGPTKPMSPTDRLDAELPF